MLVLEGNAFYEIDEDCMRRKGLKFPGEAEEKTEEPEDLQKERKESERVTMEVLNSYTKEKPR